jgi:putative ABC transport system permease protein
VVSESAARRLWPNQSPLGQTLALGRPRTVIGVVKDSGLNLLLNPDSVEVYTPIDDAEAAYATIVAHATSNAGSIAGAIRAAATVPGIVPTVRTFQSFVDQQLDGIRKMAVVVGSLATVASLLALLGIFGLVAFTVAQRTREIGVRMALGARGADILRIVIGQFALPFGAGAAVGVAVAAGAAKVFRSIVYGFIPFDAFSFGAGLLLFAAVALLASIAPARRALRIDPVSALRHE